VKKFEHFLTQLTTSKSTKVDRVILTLPCSQCSDGVYWLSHAQWPVHTDVCCCIHLSTWQQMIWLVLSRKLQLLLN